MHPAAVTSAVDATAAADAIADHRLTAPAFETTTALILPGLAPNGVSEPGGINAVICHDPNHGDR